MTKNATGPTANFERPLRGRLLVELDTIGDADPERFVPNAEDLARFDLVNKYAVYERIKQVLGEGFGGDLEDDSDDRLCALRYAVECAIFYDHTPWSNSEGEAWAEDDPEDQSTTRGILRQWHQANPVTEEPA